MPRRKQTEWFRAAQLLQEAGYALDERLSRFSRFLQQKVRRLPLPRGETDIFHDRLCDDQIVDSHEPVLRLGHPLAEPLGVQRVLVGIERRQKIRRVAPRSEERRVWKGGVGTGISRWSPFNYKHKSYKINIE